MKRKTTAPVLCLLCVLFMGFKLQPLNSKIQTPTSREIVNKMLAAIDNTKTLKFNLKTWERFGTKEIYNEMKAKINVEPFKMHMDNVEGPNKGVEVLYVTGKYENKAFVNAGKFIPNLKLDPYGDRMRKDQHHTMFSTGFKFFGTIIRGALKRESLYGPEGFEKYVVYEGDITWGGKSCYKLTINDPDFKYVDYTVKDGEDDVLKIEAKQLICGYLIVEKNSNVNNSTALKPGMQIKVPTSYAKKTVLYIDKATYLPLVQIMYDEVGQFEKYEYHNLQVNPVFKETEFSEDFEGYRF